MGKISDALEKSEKEKSVKTDRHYASTVVPGTTGEQSLDDYRKVVSVGSFDPKLVVLTEPDSVDAENFKVLRGQILFSQERERPKTIMVTSTLPGEGKTFVAANLAASIAQGLDEYVLLVDCDLRRPNLHGMFGYTNNAGLNEYLTSETELPELIIRTKIEKLSLLPAGKMPKNPTELLSSNRMIALLEEVKGRYDDRFIVIDSTPSQVTAETNMLARHVDGIILVVMAHKAPRKAVQKTIQNLGREKILGIVFNGYEEAFKGYKKYYKDYY